MDSIIHRAFFVLTVLLFGVPSTNALTPAPKSVVRYLGSHQVSVDTTQVALVEETVYKPDAPAELPVLLENSRAFRKGVSLISSIDSRGRDVADIAIQVGAHWSPVLQEKGSRLKAVPLNRIVFKLAEGSVPEDVLPVLSAYDVTDPEPVRNRQFQFDIYSPDSEWSSLQLAAELSALAAVQWAVPDFAREAEKSYLPNDVTNLWHLHNPSSVTWTNSAALEYAWNTTLGSSNIVIAILDDGVQTNHPDLAPNVWINPGEIPDDNIDNDSNGYVDDVSGWEFYHGTNRVMPDDPNEPHGTAVAGLAAARGDNSLGVCGSCPRCGLLPVKVYDGNDIATDTQLADALAYASKHADVINFSTTISGVIPQLLIDAFNNAATSALVIAASGKGADQGWVETCPSSSSSGAFRGWMRLSGFVPGNPPHTYRWTYTKDSDTSKAFDCAWIDSIQLPGGARIDFENAGLPAGWTTGGDASWYITAATNDHMVVGAYSLRSGDIGDNEESWVEVTENASGVLTFHYQCLGEMSCGSGNSTVFWDHILFSIDGTNYVRYANQSIEADWGYDPTRIRPPGNFTSVVAVGASNIEGFKSAYSCFNTNLELLAPSGGSTWHTALLTTDRTGSDGYDSGDYFASFSGTSASAPVASGIAGLIMSANPHLTPQEVRRLLQETARKIGTITYTNGYNPRYGYGQIDAAHAITNMLHAMPPEFISATEDTNTVRFGLLGIETGRSYNVYGASSLTSSGTWDWVMLPPGNLIGNPLFGTNDTPAFAVDSTNRFKVYRAEK
ncbi:MAG: S8 family serine peptidase [Verrucomicrobia bacterium]|nr:S8 family serine peptidase [Verrucomicrobiota bacterium]